MSAIKVRFHCKICNKTIMMDFSEEFQAKFKALADRYPYPLVFPHEGHYAIIYLDSDFKERGTVVSKIALTENEKSN